MFLIIMRISKIYFFLVRPLRINVMCLLEPVISSSKINTKMFIYSAFSFLCPVFFFRSLDVEDGSNWSRIMLMQGVTECFALLPERGAGAWLVKRRNITSVVTSVVYVCKSE
jgi:hypothetical protein